VGQDIIHGPTVANEAVMEQDQDILDNISTGIMALDGDLCVTALNASGQALLETSEVRCIGLHARKLVRHPKAWIHNLEAVLASNSPHASRSIALVLHSGQEIHVDVIITPVSDAAGNVSLLVELMAVDRLLKISREESLMHAQETTRAVIRGLAHEIKNPLGGVRGAAQLLARELPDDELAEYTRVIIREADRLRDLVDRLLGPNQQLAPEHLNIHEVLEHVRNLTAAESDNRATIRRDYDPSLPEFSADKAQLIQAVLNIMRNALQAAASPEQCTIVLRSRSQRQFTVGTKRHRLVCRVDIIDNGPGVPQDMLHAIFAPMVTGRADGTGLGLSIAQSIINRHGGLLECDSNPGETRFTIFLPMEVHNA
jgi:two-component system, NtrC family, nitrogen regulation sensor histidine kinase GlnL